MVKAVIFDMDGLMFDTERITADAWVYTGQQMGFPITRELAISVIGKRDSDTSTGFWALFGPELDYNRASRIRNARVHSYIEENGIPVKAGLYKLLDELQNNNIRIALASSTERERVMYLLDKARITDRFEVIVCGDMVEHGKPEPDIFLVAAYQLGLSCDDCLVLEDSPYGVTAAYRAGIPVIMVPDMIAPTADTNAMVLTTVDSLEAVIPIIKSRKDDQL